MRSLLAVACVVSIASAQQPYVRVDMEHTRALASFASVPGSSGPQMLVTGSVCGDAALAVHNQAVPGGGFLNPVAFANPVTIGAVGRIAYFTLINGSARNQGVFVSDGSGLHPIAVGCGGGGGSANPGTNVGDPSPIGGKFTGFFGGTPFAPALNAAGDVLFVADVFGGSSTRGLFLYRAASASIVKVAAVGDLLPTGASIVEIGTGSLNASGTVVFLANGASLADGHILRWQNGVTTSVARVGDVAPGGATYQFLGSEAFGFTDGTWIATGPVPDINDSGAIVFRGVTAAERGFVLVPPAGAPSWILRAGDPAPTAGNTFFDPWAPILSNSGEIAFYSDVQTPTGFTGGWYAGTPGNLRKAVEFFDAIDGGQCVGLAVSRNPMAPLSDDGDLVAWCDIDIGGVTHDVLLLARANGTQEVIRRKGDPTSIGGTVGGMDAWPVIGSGGQAALNCGTPGAPGSLSAHFLLTLCPLVQSYCTAGTTASGCTASVSGTGTPSASAANGFTIGIANVPGQKNGLVFYGIDGRAAVPWGVGSTSFLCVKTPTQRTAVQSSGGTAGQCNGALSLDFNAFRATTPVALGQPMFAGQRIDAQGWFRDPGVVKNTSLSNALEFFLAP